MLRLAVIVPSIEGYPHTEAFREVAEAFTFALRALGVDVVLTDQHGARDRQAILFGANVLLTMNRGAEIPADAVIYNLEQIYDDSPWLTADLLRCLRTHRIWDYSVANVAALARLGVSALHVPLGYVPELARIERAQSPDIDVLFVGSIVERRLRILQALHDRGLRVVPVFGLYGERRDRLIGRSKILLNMHMYDAKIFEIVRVSYLLANRCFVISETGRDPEAEAALAAAVVFSPYEQLVDRCVEYVNRPDVRRQIAETGQLIMSARSQIDALRPMVSVLSSSAWSGSSASPVASLPQRQPRLPLR